MIIEQKLTTIYVIDIGHKSQKLMQHFSVKGSNIKLLKTELVSTKKVEEKIIEYKGKLTQWTPIPIGNENAGA